MIGQKVRMRRKQLRLSQQELAGDLWTRSYVSQIELGKVTPPLETIQKLAQRLDTTVGELIGDSYLLRAAKATLFYPKICRSYLDKLPQIPTTEVIRHLLQCIISGEAPSMEIPPNPELHYMKAKVLLKQQRYSKAADAVKQGLRYSGPYWKLRLLLLSLDAHQAQNDMDTYEATQEQLETMFGKRQVEDLHHYLLTLIQSQAGTEATPELIELLRGAEWYEEMERAKTHQLF